MFRLSVASLLLAAGALHAQPQPGTHQVKLNGHTFTLPQGFSIELAAGADLAPRPICIALDEKGRLYVCDSSGSNEKTAVQLEKKPHRILRLESSKGDGKFDKQTVFVKNVMFPEGAMWLSGSRSEAAGQTKRGVNQADGSLYVAAPPHIMKFTDTNDDGVADKEEVWFDGKTLGGCANDLHGPYLGPDGYVYWCKGAFAKQEYTLPNGKKFSTRASHIFRARPDGTGIEPVMTGGMDNPVDAVFTPSGDIIFSTTFFQHPAGGKRDGLVHAVYGAVYGKDHDPVYEHPWTHPTLMAPMTHMGPAAPCGLHRLESGEFGKEYENNVFCCQFNLRKVSRHVLVPTGSTYTTKDSDFVVSDNLDFHPTDVIEDADGSLLIVDTGGWYKLCCPTSQLVKPDVTGGIYRVKRDGAHNVRVRPKPQSLPRLYTISLNRDAAGLDEAIAALKDASLHTRRLGATALGRIGNAKAVPAILEALADDKNDRPLDHALTYALIEIDDTRATRDGLKHESPRVRRAALAALSNIPGGMEPRFYVAELGAKDAALRETAWWVAGRNPQWAHQVADYLRDRLKLLPKMTAPEQDELASRLVPFLKAAAVNEVAGNALLETTDPGAQRAVLGALARSGQKALPREWVNGVRLALYSASPDVARDAVAVLRSVPPSAAQHAEIVDAVRAYRERLKRPLPPELDYALRAAAPVGTALSADDAVAAVRDIDNNRPGPVRAAAADLLARSKLTAESLTQLAAALRAANPLEVSKLLGAFEKSADPAVGSALVAGLRSPQLRQVVRIEMVKPILDKYPQAVKAEAEKLYAELAEARKDERARLDRLITDLKPGDIRRGQQVFNSPKTQCIACHKVGYVGGLVGPDLTRIGGIRTERDLLEAIVFPSASFVRSYEPVRVITTDERTLNGILKKDAPDEIIVVVAADKEERVPRADVASITPSAVSLMPSGLDQQLSPQDLADLVAFLKACK